MFLRKMFRGCRDKMISKPVCGVDFKALTICKHLYFFQRTIPYYSGREIDFLQQYDAFSAGLFKQLPVPHTNFEPSVKVVISPLTA